MVGKRNKERWIDRVKLVRQTKSGKKIHPQPKASKTSNFFKNAIMLEGIGTCHQLKYTT